MLGRQHWVAPRRFIIIVQAALDALPCPTYSGSVWGRKQQLTLDGDEGQIPRNAELIVRKLSAQIHLRMNNGNLIDVIPARRHPRPSDTFLTKSLKYHIRHQSTTTTIGEFRIKCIVDRRSMYNE